ncbi:MAG: hypothetical protein AAF430_13115 [Myxococcota bacterium]
MKPSIHAASVATELRWLVAALLFGLAIPASADDVSNLEDELEGEFAGVTVFAVGSRSVAVVGKQHDASLEKLARDCELANAIIQEWVPDRSATVVWKQGRRPDYRCKPVTPTAKRPSLETLREAVKQ